jgi:transaldolase
MSREPQPEGTLNAFADHGEVKELLSPDGGDFDDVLAAKLQRDGAEAFVRSWNGLIGGIASKSEALKQAG